MTRYLIDIRQMGATKRQISTLSRELQDTFCLGTMLVVPHITLAGPFSTDDGERLVRDFAEICSRQEAAPHYEVGGYGFFEKTRVVFVEITPDEALRQFRYRLMQAIAPYCTLREYDLVSAEEFRFHSTLAMKLDLLTFLRIKWHFRNQEPVSPRYHPIRVTLLKNSRIICEYDFSQRRMLTRAQAESRATRVRDNKVLRAWGDREGE
ncbi:2'-5' RNA ligase family protein [Methanoregula sp. UBA64]|jgi:2'-5' RNA ligase|uniref:2'-5' RNA ligase family protein n=1 Tax=Methanoregula sp. UBA64 TaxID=1915554 RepID=UPI0025FB6B26|nr:2'-5' RNA ligase family protein [Methanoregula sp. UBA64]